MVSREQLLLSALVVFALLLSRCRCHVVMSTV